DDQIMSGTGDDFVHFQAGRATLNAGNNTLVGGDGGIDVESLNGNDSITTGAGIDTVFSGDGNDIISTGDGFDTVITGGHADLGIGAIIDAGAGDDAVSSQYAKSILGGPGNDRLGALFANTIDG